MRSARCSTRCPCLALLHFTSDHFQCNTVDWQASVQGAWDGSTTDRHYSSRNMLNGGQWLHLIVSFVSPRLTAFHPCMAVLFVLAVSHDTALCLLSKRASLQGRGNPADTVLVSRNNTGVLKDTCENGFVRCFQTCTEGKMTGVLLHLQSFKGQLKQYVEMKMIEYAKVRSSFSHCIFTICKTFHFCITRCNILFTRRTTHSVRERLKGCSTGRSQRLSAARTGRLLFPSEVHTTLGSDKLRDLQEYFKNFSICRKIAQLCSEEPHKRSTS